MHSGSVVRFVTVAGLFLTSSGSALAQPAPAEPPAATQDPTAAEAPEQDPAAGTPAGEDAPTPAEPPAAADFGPEAADSDPAGTSSPAAAAAPDASGLGPLLPQDPASDGKPADEASSSDKAAAKPTAQADASGVFAEDWWTNARPILEIHGYFRVRAELLHNLSLGRVDPPGKALWPMPADHYYTDSVPQQQGPLLCTVDEAGLGDDDNPNNPLVGCRNKTQSGANLRFRLRPELHISDNLRVISQIDLLDNLIMGSTPGGYSNEPASEGGYAVNARTGYNPVGALDDTQVPPSSGRNSIQDSISVKRAWGEYATPVGLLRFGRMPDHFGLGMVHNAGDGPDDDYQSTIDRIQFVSGVRSMDLYAGGAWDFVNEGATSEGFGLPGGQPYDLSQLDDVDQYSLMVFRKKSPELTRLALSKGTVLFNGGLYLTYRKQLLANDQADEVGNCALGGATIGCGPGQGSEGYVRRGAKLLMPDLWLQALYKKFRFELEAAAVRGSIENMETVAGGDATGERKLRQWGVAGEIEQKLVEDRLALRFKSGWSSGDADVEGLYPKLDGERRQLQLGGDDTISTFRFHPSYRVDLILFRNLLTRVQGAYYFSPGLEYDFMRALNGQRLGGEFAAVWSRASEFMQTSGNRRDLGIELNGGLYYQSKDGALNDKPGQMGGLFAKLNYGVLFPMGGLKHLEADLKGNIATPQVLRLYLGVLF